MFTADVNITGSLPAVLAEQVGGVQDRLAGAVRATAESAQRKLRAQVDAAGLGQGLNKAWRLETYPPPRLGKTLRPSALVFSKSAILHEAFAEGAAVLPRRSRFLVIALPRAIAMGFGYSTVNRKGGAVPGGQKRKVSNLDAAAEALHADIVSVDSRLAAGARRRAGPGRAAARRAEIRLLPSRARPGALLAVYFPPAGAKRGEPLFLLLPASKNPKLLNLDIVQQEAEAELAANVAAALEAEE